MNNSKKNLSMITMYYQIADVFNYYQKELVEVDMNKLSKLHELISQSRHLFLDDNTDILKNHYDNIEAFNEIIDGKGLYKYKLILSYLIMVINNPRIISINFCNLFYICQRLEHRSYEEITDILNNVLIAEVIDKIDTAIPNPSDQVLMYDAILYYSIDNYKNNKSISNVIIDVIESYEKKHNENEKVLIIGTSNINYSLPDLVDQYNIDLLNEADLLKNRVKTYLDFDIKQITDIDDIFELDKKVIFKEKKDNIYSIKPLCLKKNNQQFKKKMIRGRNYESR